MGLSYDWTSMTTLVNSMSPTAIPIRRSDWQLGWMSLVGGGPFTAPAMDPNYKYTQAIILLTDGLNTQNRWYSNPEFDRCDGSNSPAIISTLPESCSTPFRSIPTARRRRPCCKTARAARAITQTPSKFFLLTSSNQILNVFTQIGTELISSELPNSAK